jgi:hypothetical protein
MRKNYLAPTTAVMFVAGPGFDPGGELGMFARWRRRQ